MIYLIGTVVVIAVACVIVAANVAYWRSLRALSPAEMAAFKDEENADRQVW